MTIVSRLFALALLGAGTALIAPSASYAQAERQATIYPVDPRPVCCTPARRPIGTDATWTVQPPSGGPHAAVPLSSHPFYHTTLPASQWVGNAASDGNYPGEAGTTFTYTKHFCLCSAPPGFDTIQAQMSLSVYSDNEFKAYLNGHPIPNGFSTAPGIFNSPPQPTLITSVPPSYFNAGSNVLTFVVTNQANTPTGLDVSGYVSGYFQSEPCQRGLPTK